MTSIYRNGIIRVCGRSRSGLGRGTCLTEYHAVHRTPLGTMLRPIHPESGKGVGEVWFVEDYARVDGKRSARNGAISGSISPVRISRASRRPISGPSVTPLWVTASL